MEQTEGTKVTNPLMGKLRLPGQTYRLPSHGLFYDNGELDESVRNGEVEVYPMTAMDEIILTTPDKLMSGKAITEVFMRSIPQIKKPDQLLSKDVDFLLACLRIVTFGPKLDIKYTHNCEGAKNHSYMIDMAQVVKDAKPIDPTTVTSDFHLTLPNGQAVVLRPLTYASIVDLYQTTLMAKQLQTAETQDEIDEAELRKFVVATLSGVIKSVDGETNRQMIEEWILAVPLGWKKKIEEVVRRAGDWGAKFETTLKCKDCGKDIVFPVSPNPVGFFS